MGWYRMYMLAPIFREEHLELSDYPEEILISKLDGRDGTNDFKSYVEKSPEALLQARRFGYEQAFRDAAKRTCRQEEQGWGTEGDHARVWLTCGHDCMVPTVQDLPNYCPECGAKVLE